MDKLLPGRFFYIYYTYAIWTNFLFESVPNLKFISYYTVCVCPNSVEGQHRISVHLSNPSPLSMGRCLCMRACEYLRINVSMVNLWLMSPFSLITIGCCRVRSISSIDRNTWVYRRLKKKNEPKLWVDFVFFVFFLCCFISLFLCFIVLTEVSLVGRLLLMY